VIFPDAKRVLTLSTWLTRLPIMLHNTTVFPAAASGIGSRSRPETGFERLHDGDHHDPRRWDRFQQRTTSFTVLVILLQFEISDN
jgi:hypothetical protein